MDRYPRKTFRLTTGDLEKLERLCEESDATVGEVIRRLIRGEQIRSKYDRKVLELAIKTHGDLGRLGGLFKLALSERRGPPSELRRLLAEIEGEKKELMGTLRRLAKAS